MRIVPLVLAFAWLAPQPGAAPAADPPSLTVFAAADLTFAFRELAPRFEKATGARVTLVFGSTGNFAHQIRQGGPADVFFAADQSFIDALIVDGALLRETRTLYAQGRLVLATARAFGPKLIDLRGLLDARVRHVAIPAVRPLLLTITMLLTGLSLGTFDAVLILTGGGPGTATVTPALYSYNRAFGVNDWPVGATSGWLIAAAVLGAGLIYLRLSRTRFVE